METAICADAGLADADRRMSDLYRQRLAAAGESGAARVRQEQQAWLRRRAECERQPDAAGALRGCIAGAIAERIAALKPPDAAAAPPLPAPAAPATFAYGPWQVTADADRCAVSRTGPQGRRLAIERPRDAVPGFPGTIAFHPGPRDAGLVQPGDRVVLLADLQRLPARVRDGAIVGTPGQEEAAARALAAARTLSVVRMLDRLIEVPLEGLPAAMADMRARCGG